MLNHHPRHAKFPFVLTLLASLPLTGWLHAQEGDDTAQEDEEVFELSPFMVESSNTGYLETNAVSGTSLNMPIRDMAISLEVINNEFLTDQQATDLKEALDYSAGVYTQSFADGSGANTTSSAERSPSSVASVNNPYSNTISIRGFAVPTQQRFGFRIGGVAVGEGFSVVLGGLTDTVNTERLEVVRGPAALLYGINVLSGVVNIIPKRPLNDFAGNASVSVGSWGFLRGQLDVTGPILKDRLNYRFLTALETRDHFTDHREQEKEYYALQFDFKLGAKTQLLLEAQYGAFNRSGIGPQFFTDDFTGANISGNPVDNIYFRNPYDEHIQFGRDDYSYLFEREETDEYDIYWIPKTKIHPDESAPLAIVGDDYRVTGPDTYYDRKEYNFMALLTTSPLENLNIELGAYYTHAEEERFDVVTDVFTNRERDIAVQLSDDVPSPLFIRKVPGRANLWVRHPEVYGLLGGYTVPSVSDTKYGLDEAVGFTFDPSAHPTIYGSDSEGRGVTDITKVTSGGLGEVFVVPFVAERVRPGGNVDADTWNAKFARYYWIKTPTEADALQLRGRLSYAFKTGAPLLGEDAIKHTFIGGYQFSRDELSIVSARPQIEDIVTLGTIEPLPDAFDVGLGSFDRDPYVLRKSVFDLTPIRYNGERVAIPGRLNTSAQEMGLPLTQYVEGGGAAGVTGWNIARSGWRDVTVEQQGYYGIYQAQIYEDKVTLYAGVRRDIYQVNEVEQLRALAGTPGKDPLGDEWFGFGSQYATLPYLIGDGSQPYTPDRWIASLPDELNEEIQYELELFREGIGEAGTGEDLFEDPQSFTTGSFGLSARVTEDISIYAMYSEGVFPNQGQRDGNDRPIPAEQTSNQEIGVKFDLLEGRISGSFAFYRIERTNATWQFNSAPSPRKWLGGRLGPQIETNPEEQKLGGFDPQSALTGDGPEALKTKAELVNGGKDPDIYQGYSYGIYQNFLHEVWDARTENDGYVARPGSINPDRLGDFGLGFLISTDAGVGGRRENAGLTVPYYWVDVNRDLVAGKHIDPVTGIDLGLMVQEAFDNALAAKEFDGNGIFYSNARPARLGAGNNPSNVTGDLVTFSDETTGVDGQIFFRLTDNYQVVFSFSYLDRQVVGNGFNLAPLIDPITGDKVPGTKYDEWVFVLGEENFTDPTDPTTFTGEGVNGLNLSYVPNYDLSIWNKYQFKEGPLKGLSLALGIKHWGESPTSIPIGGTNLAENLYATPPTKARFRFDANISYAWDMWDTTWRIALKVNNLTAEGLQYNEIRYDYIDNFGASQTELRRSRSFIEPRNFRLALSTRF